MTTIELARKAAELHDVTSAQKAYLLALSESNAADPAVELECAAYLLYTNGDAGLALSRLVPLFNSGQYQKEAMDLMLQFCYVPAAEKQEGLYRRNMAKLTKYPYFFAGGRAAVPFEDLPVRFFPFGKNGYVAYDQRTCRFGAYQDLTHEEITHYFNCGGERPIFVDDLYSQYELNYLQDCVRKSEDIARDNHIYLRFTSWANFCSYAQVIDFGTLLPQKKFVFLIEEQTEKYPIDWLKEYGVDYAAGQVKPIRIDEVRRLIWHAQLSSHNGGDFFNEVLDNHPNLIYYSSILSRDAEKLMELVEARIKKHGLAHIDEGANGTMLDQNTGAVMRGVKKHLRSARNIGKREILVAVYLTAMELRGCAPDPSLRFAPALLYQPHFESNVAAKLFCSEDGTLAQLRNRENDTLRHSPAVKGFHYVKAFFPMRRFTTSYAAAIKFAANMAAEARTDHSVSNILYRRLLTQEFWQDPDDPLYNDARVVRFEDGKLNPKATFTALARFLDIPYTESMTYCSEYGVKDVETMAGNAVGFDPAPVYRTYDAFASKTTRWVVECWLKGAMEHYGYDFHYYHWEEPTEDLLRQAYWDETRLWRKYQEDAFEMELETASGSEKEALEKHCREFKKMSQVLEGAMQQEESILEGIQNMDVALRLLRGQLRLVGKTGRALTYIQAIRPDPDLLDQPLYH